MPFRKFAIDAYAMKNREMKNLRDRKKNRGRDEDRQREREIKRLQVERYQWTLFSYNYDIFYYRLALPLFCSHSMLACMSFSLFRS